MVFCLIFRENDSIVQELQLSRQKEALKNRIPNSVHQSQVKDEVFYEFFPWNFRQLLRIFFWTISKLLK
jgi:hypothetical protein